MKYDEIEALRSLFIRVERADPNSVKLLAFEDEYLSAPPGISVIVPVHNGAAEMDELLMSLRKQTLARNRYEVIFSLNGCDDSSLEKVSEFSNSSGVSTVILTSNVANVACARNVAIQQARFRHATFVDHDDYLSRSYLEECVYLSDYRSVVVSNIIKIEDDTLVEDYAQKVISLGFVTSYVHSPNDIVLCYRAYTLNAVKTAPVYMLRRIKYDESLKHSEDVKFWRDLFVKFTPITVKSPGRKDLYYRKVVKNSLSRNQRNFYEKSKPRIDIIDHIDNESRLFVCDSPQRKFDDKIKNLLVSTLFNLSKSCVAIVLVLRNFEELDIMWMA